MMNRWVVTGAFLAWLIAVPIQAFSGVVRTKSGCELEFAGDIPAAAWVGACVNGRADGYGLSITRHFRTQGEVVVVTFGRFLNGEFNFDLHEEISTEISTGKTTLSAYEDFGRGVRQVDSTGDPWREFARRSMELARRQRVVAPQVFPASLSDANNLLNGTANQPPTNSARASDAQGNPDTTARVHTIHTKGYDQRTGVFALPFPFVAVGTRSDQVARFRGLVEEIVYSSNWIWTVSRGLAEPSWSVLSSRNSSTPFECAAGNWVVLGIVMSSNEVGRAWSAICEAAISRETFSKIDRACERASAEYSVPMHPSYLPCWEIHVVYVSPQTMSYVERDGSFRRLYREHYFSMLQNSHAQLREEFVAAFLRECPTGSSPPRCRAVFRS